MFILTRRCPFLALWMQQAAANRRKARHNAKAKNERFLLGDARDSATARNGPQTTANVSFSAC
jgi:hypothetical protein